MTDSKPRLSDPVQLLAFGFGSGLAPKAPGTFGTLAALPLYGLFMGQSLTVYTVIVVIAGVLGVWICQRASQRLGVHDHPGIVWDEFVGLWVTLWAVPAEPVWVVAGFLLFRVFDIAKPGPVGWLDRNATGGFGIMIDDIAAGLLACASLHLIMFLWPLP